MRYIPDNITDCLIEMDTAIGKAELMLDDLTNKYTFNEQPKVAYFDYANKAAQKWLWEYYRIMKIVDIVYDYVLETHERIERAIQLDDEHRKAGTQS